MSAVPERLPEMLGRLKLGAVRDRLDTLLDEAGRRELSLREAIRLGCSVLFVPATGLITTLARPTPRAGSRRGSATSPSPSC